MEVESGAFFMNGDFTGYKEKYTTTMSGNPSHTHVLPHLAYLISALKHARCVLGEGGEGQKLGIIHYIADGSS